MKNNQVFKMLNTKKNSNQLIIDKNIDIKSTFKAIFISHSKINGNFGGFLRPIKSNNKNNSDYLLNSKKLHNVIHGDLVQAKIVRQAKNGRYIADIINVIRHSQNIIPAVLIKNNGKSWLARPLLPQITRFIYINKVINKAKPNDVVSIKFNEKSNGKNISGSLIENLGRVDGFGVDNKIVATTFNLKTKFSNETEKELSKIPNFIQKEWLIGREDLRNILTVTIDPDDARDFDDAISIDRLPASQGSGWVLGIHISDVSHYIREGSSLDKEALQRGTSVYFPDQCISMLPNQLSCNLCSLVENEDRLTITIWITINSDYTIRSTRISESIIRSNKRLTYEQVKEACIELSTSLRMSLGKDLCQMLDDGLKISNHFMQARLYKGAIKATSKEVKFKFNSKNNVVDACCMQHNKAHEMIEEFMLLANETVANFFADKQIPVIYRIHDIPDQIKLDIFKTTVANLTLNIDIKHQTINEILNYIKYNPLEGVLNDLLIRSLKRAEYSTNNIGHFGLSLENYLHFTSPIRRYPDLIVHRILRKVLHGQTLHKNTNNYLEKIAKLCSSLEQNATEAERENKRYKACALMKNKLGQQFVGQIIGLSNKYVYIQLDKPFVEVYTNLASISKDFIVNSNCTKAISKNVDLAIIIGDKVKVKIAEIDNCTHKIYVNLIEIYVANKNKNT